MIKHYIQKVEGTKTIFMVLVTGVLLSAPTISLGADLNLVEATGTSGGEVNVFLTLDNSESMYAEFNYNYRWTMQSYLHYGATGDVAEDSNLDTQYLGQTLLTCGSRQHNFYHIWGTEQINAYNATQSKDNACREVTFVELPQLAYIDWRLISNDGNRLYYNPKRTYEPWPGYPPADFFAARDNPVSSSEGFAVHYNLATDTRLNGPGFKFAVWQDSRGYSGPSPKPDEFTATPNGEVDLWDNHTLYTVNASSIEVTEINFNPNSNKLKSASIDSACKFGDQYPTFGFEQCLGRTESSKAWLNPFGRNQAQERQNIANWFTYYRSRNLESRMGIAKIFQSFPAINFGATTLTKQGDPGSVMAPIRPTNIDHATHNKTIIDKLYNTHVEEQTFLGDAALFVGDYFKGDNATYSSPIDSACEQSFHVLITDGARNNDWNTARPDIGDHDNDGHSFSVNSDAVSMADIASYFYMTDLSPSLPNTAPSTSRFCTGARQVNHQSLSFMALSYGSPEEFNRNTLANSCWPKDAWSVSDNWGKPFPRSASSWHAEDPHFFDLWHAAFNSNGYFNFFQDNYEMLDKFKSYFDAISVSGGGVSKSALSTNILTDNSLFFTASYDWAKNAGMLQAYQPKESMGVNTFVEVWTTEDGATDITKPIYSYNPTSKAGIKLEYKGQGASLSDSQFSRLYPSESISRKTELLTQFVDTLYTSPLGPIINSNLAYVGRPNLKNQFYGASVNSAIYDQKFSEFVGSSTRSPMLYVNSNDGKLHGYNASTGAQALMYVPNVVLSERYQTRQVANAQLFLDGEIFVGDAFLKKRNKWSTILLGSMRSAGQGIYALDVTAPDSFSQSDVLWEFSDANDQDLGFTYAKPAIGYIGDRWVAVIANGYNNTHNSVYDPFTSTTGAGALYILDLETGELLRKFTTAANQSSDPLNLDRPNGLAEPAIVDSDQDGVIDRIYVGDFFGNFYAFDVKGNDPTQWQPTFGTAEAAKPMVAGSLVNNLQIITRPTVTPDPTRDELFIIYGTGDNITDATYTQDHRLIGISHQATALTDTALLEGRTLEAQGKFGWSIQLEDKTPKPDAIGWIMTLTGDTKGYRTTIKPRLYFGELLWALHKPGAAASGSCSSSSESSLIFAMNPYTGGPLAKNVFLDLPLDSDADGISSPEQIQSFDVVKTEDGELIVGSTTTQNTFTFNKRPLTNTTQRQSWRPL